jgi:hypothetical protein
MKISVISNFSNQNWSTFLISFILILALKACIVMFSQILPGSKAAYTVLTGAVSPFCGAGVKVKGRKTRTGF